MPQFTALHWTQSFGSFCIENSGWSNRSVEIAERLSLAREMWSTCEVYNQRRPISTREFKLTVTHATAKWSELHWHCIAAGQRVRFTIEWWEKCMCGLQFRFVFYVVITSGSEFWWLCISKLVLLQFRECWKAILAPRVYDIIYLFYL